ncbi:hypothetical protein [Streptomyces sp. URMC 123]|uniref:hypothetical protein n=1 Tax=Streptomyces sp. URMC 123 TaxID=3423403 RepID=UPI003F19D313
MSSWEWAGLVPVVVSAVHALGAVWYRSWAVGPSGRPARRGQASPAASPSSGSYTHVRQVLRHESADGGVLTVWTAVTVRTAVERREEPGLW